MMMFENSYMMVNDEQLSTMIGYQSHSGGILKYLFSARMQTWNFPIAIFLTSVIVLVGFIFISVVSSTMASFELCSSLFSSLDSESSIISSDSASSIILVCHWISNNFACPIICNALISQVNEPPNFFIHLWSGWRNVINVHRH